MLKKIRLINYRRFSDFTVHLRSRNVLVGPNNAGKSAVVDAVRILDSALKHAFGTRPRFERINEGDYGNVIDIPDVKLPISLENVNHNYSDDDARLEYVFQDETQAILFMHPSRITRLALKVGGSRLTSGSQIRKHFEFRFVIVPTIMPLLADEPYVTDETLRKQQSGRAASRHFRNNWYRRSDEEFETFAQQVNYAWPDITISRPEMNDQRLSMFFSEHRLDREVNWSGFGFQVWLQLLTHLLRGTPDSIIIIDEPDIYLHPDLQKKLIDILVERSQQFLIATHAVEIINHCPSEDIVTINPVSGRAYRLKSASELSKIYADIGAAKNADYAKIAKVRKVIFFEGDDAKTYQRLGRRFGFKNLASGDYPFVKLGGFEQWTRARDAVWAFKALIDLDISAFAVFDRDYRPEATVQEFIESAKNHTGEFCVIGVKEIENYLLNVDAIHRIIVGREGLGDVDKERIRSVLVDAMEPLKNHTKSRLIAAELEEKANKSNALAETTIIEHAMQEFDTAWEDFDRRLTIVPGKKALKNVNTILQDAGLGNVTPSKIISEMRASSVPNNLLAVLKQLDDFCAS